jgi:HEPN domain-containing protein
MKKQVAFRRRRPDGAVASDDILDRAARIVDVLQPEKVILFGSQARGDAHEWSDIDFLVVVPDGQDEKAASSAARAALGGSPWCDVFVASTERIRTSGDAVGTVFRAALREGKLVYDRTAVPAWDAARLAASMGVEPATEETRQELTRQWLRDARGDLQVAELTESHGDLADAACYHAQQAAEKALKAVLVFLQIDYPFTHNLNAVRTRIPVGWTCKDVGGELQWLSGWSYKGRYPGPWPEATTADASSALDLAREILDSVERDLGAHGYVEEG